MDKGLRPVPALYACYLLRSSVRHSSLYIGSTPDPVRRLRQHNGGVKGGAVRTSRDSLRPWEAVCLVTGFPSKIAALQFEWAWQNTHLTRHISADDRITTSKVKVKVSQRTGRVWKSRARPRTSLTDRLANLHLLLLATSFQRWPLKVTFYAEDVYKMWQRWMAKQLEAVPRHVAIDLETITKSAETIEDSEVEDAVLPTGLPALQVDYTATKSHLSKTQTLIADGELQACSICHDKLAQDGSGIVSCVHDSCHMMAHMSCLAAAFLVSQPTAIIPTHGKCPKCSETLQWVDLVRELSLRMRGEADIAKLFKVPRTRRKKQANGTVVEEVVAEPDVEEDEPEEEVWHNLSQSSMDIDEFESPPKTVALPARRSTKGSKARKAVIVRKDTVEDSDWDEAELVT